jgi:hypothetical protein
VKLSPALVDLIRALAEDAVAKGYLSPNPANAQEIPEKCAERVPLPQRDQAA